MKLRSKFALLVTGIFVIPAAITLILGFIYLTFSGTGSEISKMLSISLWMKREFFYPGGNKTIVPDTLPPKGLDILLADEDGRVVYSSFPEIEKNTNRTLGSLYDSLHTKLKHSLVMSEYVQDAKTGKQYTAFLAIEKEKSSFFFPDTGFPVFPVILIALTVITAAIGVVAMGRIGRSIIRLESATKHIVDGNLDFRLAASGNDEIASLTRSFDSMRGKLKEEYEKRSRFLMAVSHDLATPLTSIEGYTEAIIDGFAADDATRTKYLSVILEKSKVLDTRIGELIDFVRMETGDWMMKCAPSDVKEFLSGISKLYAEDAQVFRRQFESKIDLPGAMLVSMDKNLVIRALENLFHNAVRYSKDDDSVSLAARYVEAGGAGEILLAISDTGYGIAQDEIAHIFDPFFRGKRFSKEKGFGLGLSTVRSIIEAHGWTISVSSEQGKGSIFEIRIPADKDLSD
jgi:signal transduction histidine kinase